jgi:hypothetical protein
MFFLSASRILIRYCVQYTRPSTSIERAELSRLNSSTPVTTLRGEGAVEGALLNAIDGRFVQRAATPLALQGPGALDAKA